MSTSTKGGRGRESIDTDRTKDFPHGLKIPILRGPPFRSWASNQSGYKHAMPEERACKRCARRASSYEKTVVLSRERFAADNRRPVRFVHRRLSLQNPSTTPHVYHRASHHGPMAYILIAGEKIFTDRESRSNFPKSYSKILPNLSSRENGVYTTANEKLRFVCLLNVNINITHSTFSIINSNFTITRLMFIYVCTYDSSRATILTNIISLRNAIVSNKRNGIFHDRWYKLIICACSFFPPFLFYRPNTSCPTPLFRSTYIRTTNRETNYRNSRKIIDNSLEFTTRICIIYRKKI